ncbi:hypothetical protein FQN49_002704 [Arthroderma sp. PD_2]|nr:hypothetical protein FQN49_002704 [Arthroderma sp. PD_2]
MARIRSSFLRTALCLSLLPAVATASLVVQEENAYSVSRPKDSSRQVSKPLFDELEELARIVDIAYCVGNWGIYEPFTCPGFCDEFPDFRLVKVYMPYPNATDPSDGKCENCTAHGGFIRSWENTRPEIIPTLLKTVKKYPDYQLVVTGHSLGGAVAALASLEFKLRGWNPHVTTFGEPRVGNQALADYIGRIFGLNSTARSNEDAATDLHLPYRRITHIDDPVPLLPPSNLDYRMHAGEIYITKVEVPPSISDLRVCHGPADPTCINQQEEGYARKLRSALPWLPSELSVDDQNSLDSDDLDSQVEERMVKPWELFFAHRDYFHRVGICFPNLFDSSPGDNGKKAPWWKWKWPFPGHGNA